MFFDSKTECLHSLRSVETMQTMRFEGKIHMYAIEFEADVPDGMIKIPSQYKELYSSHIKVIVLLVDPKAIMPLEKTQGEEKRQFSHEYINSNWRELIMTSTYLLQEDDKILQEEYGEYLSAKHSS